MSQRSDDRELLTRYLLGVTSGDECEAVEDRYFVGGGELAELLQVEDELIDDYVRGALTTSERGLFEENFLCTAERRHRLEFVRGLAEALASVEAKQVPAPRRGAVTRAPGGAMDDAVSRQGSSRGQPTLDYKPELLDSLLGWLDPVRERAAEKYEAIRRRLIEMFAMRGVAEAEDLADVTIDRVARKSPELMGTYVGDPVPYFFGVARLVLQESQRGQSARVPVTSEADVTGGVGDPEQTNKCLEKCLGQLSAGDRELIMQYYVFDETSRPIRRKDLAQSLGISVNALRIRASRIRAVLQKCVKACLDNSKS